MSHAGKRRDVGRIHNVLKRTISNQVAKDAALVRELGADDDEVRRFAEQRRAEYEEYVLGQAIAKLSDATLVEGPARMQ